MLTIFLVNQEWFIIPAKRLLLQKDLIDRNKHVKLAGSGSQNYFKIDHLEGATDPTVEQGTGHNHSMFFVVRGILLYSACCLEQIHGCVHLHFKMGFSSGPVQMGPIQRLIRALQSRCKTIQNLSHRR